MSTRLAHQRSADSASRFTAGAERRRITASKLSVPPRRPGIVDRPALLDSLMAATHTPVVLVSGPAGYGKTTLLALWCERDERPFAWVSLDASDNDPAVLTDDIVAALAPVIEHDQGIADESMLPALLDACAASECAFVLVLDDLHLVGERRCHTTIGYLAEHLPVSCQLALATRIDPPLPLATWRAHGWLAEVRAAELSLGDAEAHALLMAAGVHLKENRISRLVDRTEGWPAGIYLAALSLRDHADPDACVDRFVGASRHVADFLSEDVLARQPEDVIGFLLQTCVLDELTVSLCDAVTDGSGADALLRELERSNLFVIPLDEKRHAYRYHHLFAQYLRAELARRDPETVVELHRRASRWYREHGLVGRAITHAHAAGDVKVAGELVSAAWSDLFRDGQLETVRAWLSGFDDAQIEGHAPLAIAAAWTAALSGEPERAAHFSDAARHGSWDGSMPDGSASLESALAMMSAAFGHEGISRMRTIAQRATDLEPAANRHRAVALELLGTALTLQGDFDRAREALAEAVRLAGEESSPRAFSLAQLAVITLREGDVDSAFAYAQLAQVVVELPRMQASIANVATHCVVADLCSRRGDLQGAAVAVERANAMLPRLTEGFWWLMIETRILLAPALLALRRGDEAAVRLDEAAALLAEHPDAGTLPEWHREAVLNLRAAGRRASQPNALSDAERRILRLLATDLTLREIGRELYLSLNTVKTHTHSIYRKLEVSSRAEAVRASRNEATATGSDSPG